MVARCRSLDSDIWPFGHFPAVGTSSRASNRSKCGSSPNADATRLSVVTLGPFFVLVVIGVWFSLSLSFPENLTPLADIFGVLSLFISLNWAAFSDSRTIAYGFAAIAAFLFVFTNGIATATDAIRIPSENIYRVKVKGGETRHVSLLRSFEKGILTFDSSTIRTEFIRWDQIEGVSRFVREERSASGCRILEYYCDPFIEP
jgi:hypothetical protein